jgi:hypothetical protein
LLAWHRLADKQLVINLVVTDLLTITATRVTGLGSNLHEYLVADRAALT